jgi:hypothetical protein
MIPIEVLNPSVLLSFLPPGKTRAYNTFLTKVKSLVSHEIFLEVFINDSSNLFESLAVEYCFELNQPGKALTLLIDALQNRQIHMV